MRVFHLLIALEKSTSLRLQNVLVLEDLLVRGLDFAEFDEHLEVFFAAGAMQLASDRRGRV
jgi:hypothetical protein